MRKLYTMVVVALLGVLVFSTVAVATALAVEEPRECRSGLKEEGSIKLFLCVEGKRIGTSTEKVTTPISLNLNKGTRFHLGFEEESGTRVHRNVSCPEGHQYNNGKLESGDNTVTIAALIVEFHECIVEEYEKARENCPTNGYLGLAPLEGRFMSEVGTLILSKGGILTEFNLLGCPPYTMYAKWRMEREAKGPECQISEIETELSAHEFKCEDEPEKNINGKRSNIIQGTLEREFIFQGKLELSSKKKFKVIKTVKY